MRDLLGVLLCSALFANGCFFLIPVCLAWLNVTKIPSVLAEVCYRDWTSYQCRDNLEIVSLSTLYSPRPALIVLIEFPGLKADQAEETAQEPERMSTLFVDEHPKWNVNTESRYAELFHHGHAPVFSGDLAHAEPWLSWLQQAGYTVQCISAESLLTMQLHPDLVFLRSRDDGRAAVAFFRKVFKKVLHLTFILLVDQAHPRVAMEAIRKGMQDCIEIKRRGLLLAACRRLIGRSNSKRTQKRAHPKQTPLHPFEKSGNEHHLDLLSPPLILQAQLFQWGDDDHPVVFVGEPGTEKRDWAHWVHMRSNRRESLFFTLPQPALSPDALVAELFGVKPGPGVFPWRGWLGKLSWKGTLFIPDLEQLSLSVQALLASVIGQGWYLTPPGRKKNLLHARLMLGCSMDPIEGIQAHLIHPDLGPFLSHVVFIPPLRDRLEELPSLVYQCLAKASALYGKSVRGISKACLRALVLHPWSGNTEELQRTINRAVIRAAGEDLQWSDLPALGDQTTAPLSQDLSLKHMERQLIFRTLAVHHGNKTAAAAALGMSRRGLYKKLQGFSKE